MEGKPRGEPPDLVGHDEKRANIFLMIVLRQVLQEGKCFFYMKRRIEKKIQTNHNLFDMATDVGTEILTEQ
jgi:hypothetical protein